MSDIINTKVVKLEDEIDTISFHSLFIDYTDKNQLANKFNIPGEEIRLHEHFKSTVVTPKEIQVSFLIIYTDEEGYDYILKSRYDVEKTKEISKLFKLKLKNV